MTVAILGRIKWDWGKGDVVVIRVDDRFFAQCEERDDEDEAEEITPELVVDLLTRLGVRLTNAGRAWMKKQRDLWARYEMAEKKPKEPERHVETSSYPRWG